MPLIIILFSMWSFFFVSLATLAIIMLIVGSDLLLNKDFAQFVFGICATGFSFSVVISVVSLSIVLFAKSINSFCASTVVLRSFTVFFRSYSHSSSAATFKSPSRSGSHERVMIVEFFRFFCRCVSKF